MTDVHLELGPVLVGGILAGLGGLVASAPTGIVILAFAGIALLPHTRKNGFQSVW
jgi:hypothetical protein